MNTLQMKQKMLELGVSDTYMAECCGVGVYYFRQIFAGTKPMTGKLKQKIEGVFKTLLIKPKSAEEQPKVVVESDGFCQVKVKSVEEANREQELKVEWLKGKIAGLHTALSVVDATVSSEERTYSQGFVRMLCDVQRNLCSTTWDLLDILTKKEVQ